MNARPDPNCSFAHQLPKGLKVDEVVRLDAPQSVVGPTGNGK